MAKISSAKVDAAIRSNVFADLNLEGFVKLNDRSFGKIVTDMTGVDRLVRVNVVVASERKDMTAQELMEAEISEYVAKQESKAEKARERAEKAAKDKAKREAAKAAAANPES